MATEDEQMATQLLRTGATVPEQQQAQLAGGLL